MFKADADKMRLEAAAMKDNPLLIQKIIAEKFIGQGSDHDGAQRRQVLFRE
jgi:hypothetical protein